MKKLDVGCGFGRRPAAGFDMYCDVIPPGQGMPTPYVQCPAEKLPFDNKEFDYVRCHHVIEHTTDPGKACSELIRVGKAGILSFPPPQAEIMFGRRDHNWFVFVDRGRLLFVKKRHASYGIPRAITRCQLNVNFEWVDSFEWQVVE